MFTNPIPMALRSEGAWIAVLVPTEGVDVPLLCWLCGV